MANKIKIALLTITSNNIGAILQALATKEYITQNVENCEVDILKMKAGVDYNSGIISKTQGNIVKRAIIFALDIYRYPRKYIGVKRKNKFRNSYFSFIPRNSLNNFIDNLPKYDIYLTGSDQVFNPTAPQERKNVFFQKFDKSNAKRISYSSSFGVNEFSREFEEEIRDSILDFDALSCREYSGAEFLSKITGKDVPCVVDPTLLLDAQSWSKFAVQPSYKHKYILIYDLDGAESLVEIAQKIKAEKGYKIVCLTQKTYKFYKVDKQIYGAGPAEFLGWFANAEYIVTDAFHGTIFAINYNKPFTSYIAFKKGAIRIVSLLEKLSLSERIVNNSKTFVFKPELLTLSYNKQVFSSIVESSRNYLTNCFKYK